MRLGYNVGIQRRRSRVAGGRDYERIRTGMSVSYRF
jgi:hypothetical protein